MSAVPKRKSEFEPKPERERLFEHSKEKDAEPIYIDGFQALIEQKEVTIREIVAMIRVNKYITRRMISKQFGISMRTASRYLGIIRSRVEKGTLKI